MELGVRYLLVSQFPVKLIPSFGAILSKNFFGNSVTFKKNGTDFHLKIFALTTTLLESARGPFWGREKKVFFSLKTCLF